jgi:hypothetical protein
MQIFQFHNFNYCFSIGHSTGKALWVRGGPEFGSSHSIQHAIQHRHWSNCGHHQSPCSASKYHRTERQRRRCKHFWINPFHATRSSLIRMLIFRINSETMNSLRRTLTIQGNTEIRVDTSASPSEIHTCHHGVRDIRDCSAVRSRGFPWSVHFVFTLLSITYIKLAEGFKNECRKFIIKFLHRYTNSVLE